VPNSRMPLSALCMLRTGTVCKGSTLFTGIRMLQVHWCRTKADAEPVLVCWV